MAQRITRDIFEKHVQGTVAGALVHETTQVLTRLTKAAQSGAGLPDPEVRVYISSRVVKHMYDKKPAEEFDAITGSLHKIFHLPDQVYVNKDGKRGDFLFVKEVRGETYAASAEAEMLETSHGQVAVLTCVTAFRIRKVSYLENYKLLWTWKGDIPSS